MSTPNINITVSNPQETNIFTLCFGDCNFLKPTLQCKVIPFFSVGYRPSELHFINRHQPRQPRPVTVVRDANILTTASTTNYNNGTWLTGTYSAPPGYVWLSVILRLNSGFMGNRRFMLPFRIRQGAALRRSTLEFPPHAKHQLRELDLITGNYDVVMPEDLDEKAWKPYLNGGELSNYLYEDLYVETETLSEETQPYVPALEPVVAQVTTVSGKQIQVNKPARRRAIISRAIRRIPD